MPDPAGQNSNPIGLDEDIRALTLEQWRLRCEIDRLREEHRRLLDHKPSENGNSEGKEEGQEEGDGKQDKKQAGSKDGEGDEKKAPKPPLKQRASAWLAHIQ